MNRNNIAALTVLLLIFNSLTFSQSFDYYYPKNNSILVSLSTDIILRSNENIDRTSLTRSEFKIAGNISGLHSGEVKLSDDNKTIIFLPSVPFSANENVQVIVNRGIKTTDGKPLPKVAINFKTTPLLHPIDYRTILQAENESVNSADDLTMYKSPNNVSDADSLPSNFPKVTVDTSNNPAPGNIFMAYDNGDYSSNNSENNFLFILNNNGNVLKYKNTNFPATNFRVQSNGELSYSDVISLSNSVFVECDWILMDTNLVPVDTFKCGNGYDADSHDFLLLPNGHALLFASDPEPYDMRPYGGDSNSTVIGAVIQELDASKNVIFQWRSWDYLPITDSYKNLTQNTVDLIHANALETDQNGNIYFSMRYLSSIIKIDRQTGNIIWFLGGKQNQFTFVNEHQENAPTYFSYQHDINFLPNGDLTLFDNGNQHSPKYSRAVEYKLNEQNKTATLIWEYRHKPDIYASAMGSVQRLENGNTLIGWGQATYNNKVPAFTEVHPDNSVALEMSIPLQQTSYRVYKFPWPSGTAESSATLEVLQGNNYNFNSGQDTTGVMITFNQLNSNSTHIYFTVARYNYAPLNPEFTATAPNMFSNYFSIEGSSYTGNVVVNLNYYPAVLDPKETIVYAKSDSGNKFIPLPTSYDSVKNELTFTTSILGEFAFGIPQTVDSAYAPVPIAPKDREIVNGLNPVQLVWGTKGIVQTYHLQVSTDESFGNLMVDNSSLKSTVFNINSVADNTTYYWRVNNTNAAGTSNWSKVERFMTEQSYIKIIYPKGGDVLFNDSTYVIKWQSNISVSVNVELLKNNTVVRVIGDSILSGTYAINWQILSSRQMDSTYKIRITSINDPSITCQNDTTFTIMNGITGVSDLNNRITSYQLYQNYPNPFNPSTVIEYTVPEESQVRIDIFNAIGQRVAALENGMKMSGNYEIRWNASNLSSGVYFYAIKAAGINGKNFFSVKKMILLK